VGALKGIALAALLAIAAPAAGEPVDRWTGHINEAAARFGIPADWIRRVIRIESGGHTSLWGQPVVSTAGAMGLMQLMPGTWRDMRSLLGLGTDPFDPRDNILAGSAYLRLMYDRFGYPGMFAAYNAGPRRYAAHLATGAALPAETRHYLAKAAAGERPTSMLASARPNLFAAGPSAATVSERRVALSPAIGSAIFVELRAASRR